MAQFILTRSSRFSRTLRTHSLFPLDVRIGQFFLLFAMAFLIGVLSFVYLVKFTEIHTKGYQLRKLEIEHDKLLTAREVQSMQISKQKALANIRESTIASSMVPARSSLFINNDGAAIAQVAIEKP